MTLKDTYKYLESIKKIDNEIRKQQLKHDALQSCLLPKAIAYDKDAVQTSPQDKMSEIASEVLDIEKRLEQLIVIKAEKVKEISENISLLENDTEQIVLLGFYVGGRSITEIMDAMHYSERSIYRLRRRGVRRLSEKLSVNGRA